MTVITTSIPKWAWNITYWSKKQNMRKTERWNGVIRSRRSGWFEEHKSRFFHQARNIKNTPTCISLRLLQGCTLKPLVPAPGSFMPFFFFFGRTSSFLFLLFPWYSSTPTTFFYHILVIWKNVTHVIHRKLPQKLWRLNLILSFL